jgi:hypothetical protein
MKRLRPDRFDQVIKLIIAITALLAVIHQFFK